MNKTFQSFVFGCRVNEAERIKIDRELIEAGYTVDLASPTFLIVNTCAITGKAEREAKQLINQLAKKYPEGKIVITGCSATLWNKYKTGDGNSVCLIVPNDRKSSLVSLLQTSEVCKAQEETRKVVATTKNGMNDKFRYSNRLLVKIQDGCHRFCSYCIVPYLRGLPQSQKIKDIVTYVNSFGPTPSEVTLSAINTESFGKDTGETLDDLVRAVLKETSVPRIAFGSIHPWSLTDEFIEYYRHTLSQEKRFVHFFHIPIQSGSQTILRQMRREYAISDIATKLITLKTIRPDVLIATDIIVGYLGETKELFEETYSFLKKSPISRFHVFRFSNRPHTAAYYLKKQLVEPTLNDKKERSHKLMELSKIKYNTFLTSQVGREYDALVITQQKQGVKILLNNQVEGVLVGKDCLPGSMVHVTIIAAKDGMVTCKES